MYPQNKNLGGYSTGQEDRSLVSDPGVPIALVFCLSITFYNLEGLGQEKLINAGEQKSDIQPFPTPGRHSATLGALGSWLQCLPHGKHLL